MSDKKKVFYISGKITGLDINVAKANFKEGEKVVHEMGAISVNPFDILEQKDEYTWVDYMRADIKALCDCDGILMLPDWKESEGAKLELHIAERLQMEVIYLG